MTSLQGSVDTVVITVGDVDYGTGKAVDRVVFHDCKYRVEDGTLHIYPTDDPGTPKIGNVATFAPGSWASVLRGQIVDLGERAAGAPAHRHTLEAVSD